MARVDLPDVPPDQIADDLLDRGNPGLCALLVTFRERVGVPRTDGLMRVWESRTDERWRMSQVARDLGQGAWRVRDEGGL